MRGSPLSARFSRMRSHGCKGEAGTVTSSKLRSYLPLAFAAGSRSLRSLLACAIVDLPSMQTSRADSYGVRHSHERRSGSNQSWNKNSVGGPLDGSIETHILYRAATMQTRSCSLSRENEQSQCVAQQEDDPQTIDLVLSLWSSRQPDRALSHETCQLSRSRI